MDDEIFEFDDYEDDYQLYCNSFSFLDDEEEDIYMESDGTPISKEVIP